MTSPATHKAAVSPTLIVGVIVACAFAAWLLMPSGEMLLDRQVRDGSNARALATLRGLPEKVRAHNPAKFGLLEMRLERLLLATNASPTEILGILEQGAKIAETGKFPNGMEVELASLLTLLKDSEAAHLWLSKRSRWIPMDAQRRLTSSLIQQALASSQPAKAATWEVELWPKLPKTLPDAVELIRLCRLAGKPDLALTTLAQYPPAIADEAGRRNFAREQIALLRELGRSKEAFKLIQSLFQTAPAGEKPELLPLLITVGRESGSASEVLQPAMEEAQSKTGTAADWEVVIELAMASSKNEIALNAVTELLRLKPESGAAWFRKAQLLEWNNHPSEAFDTYLKALQLKESRAVERLFALNPGLVRDVELVEALTRALSWLPKEGYQLEIARLEARVGHFESATQIYNNLLKARSGDFLLRAEYGRLLLDLFDFEKAVSILKSASLLRPDDIGVRQGLAEAYFRLNRYEDALAVYKDLSNEEGGDLLLDNYINLAEAMGRLDEVVNGFDQLMKRKNAAKARDFLRLAFIRGQRGESKLVQETLLEGVKKFPEDAALRLQAAYSLSDAERSDEALKMVESHPDLATDAGIMRLYLGLLVQTQQYGRAAAFLASGLPEGALAELVDTRLQILEAQSKLKEAASLAGSLRERDPTNRRYLMNHARLLAELGKSKEAESLIKPLLANPSPDVLKLAAQVYAALGQYKTAEVWQRRYLETHPAESSQAYGFLGDILLSRGGKIDARHAYERGIQAMSLEPSAKPKK